MARQWMFLTLVCLGLIGPTEALAQFVPGTMQGNAPGFPFPSQGPPPTQYVPGTTFGSQPDYPIPPHPTEPTPLVRTGPGNGPPGMGVPAQNLTGAPPVALTNDHYSVNAFDDLDTVGSLEPSTYSEATVDILVLWTDFDRNPAFSTNVRNFDVTTPGDVDFDYESPRVIPRLNLNYQFSPYWGVRGSWMQLSYAANTIAFSNNDPMARFLSVTPASGNVPVVETQQVILSGVTTTDSTLTAVENRPIQIQSPNNFFFLDLVPTESLQDIPPQTLGPFPFFNSVQMGFPDMLAFGSGLRLTVVDAQATRYIEIGSATGLIGAGVRYAYLSQNYTATRFSAGGIEQTVGYDPFVNLDDDAQLNLAIDRDEIFYGHNFGGVGPKFSVELGQDMGVVGRVFSKLHGTVLFGNRSEVAYLNGQQQGIISDIDRNIPSDITYNQNIGGPGAAFENNTFSVIPVGEVEAGVEFRLGIGKIIPLVRVAGFAQAWINGGNATNPNANLYLYGVNATVGFGF
ncbi:MAG: hypothetical protein ACFCD0_30245 [Gemmataceae bacterium]